MSTNPIGKRELGRGRGGRRGRRTARGAVASALAGLGLGRQGRAQAVESRTAAQLEQIFASETGPSLVDMAEALYQRIYNSERGAGPRLTLASPISNSLADFFVVNSVELIQRVNELAGKEFLRVLLIDTTREGTHLAAGVSEEALARIKAPQSPT